MSVHLRVALMGPMGIGKTTAIRTVCGDLAVDCDVPNLDTATHAKATTTVGADFGEVDLGDGDKLQIYGCPGQERFNFVRQWVLSSSVGVFVMTDLHEPDAVAETARLLAEVARPATHAQIDAFAAALMQKGAGLVPVLQADVRDRQQMLDMLQVLASMLSLKDETV
jgi:signal recognition particle receptor subunit beta